MTAETDAVIGYIKSLGILHRVTDINTPGVHTKTSFHYAEGTPSGSGHIGLAVDFAGTSSGTAPAMVAQMQAIWRAFRPLAPQLAELFFNSPETQMVVKNGAWRPGLATLGATTWNAHRNHCHVAVPLGTFLAPATIKAASATPVPAHTETVPIPVHDFEEATMKQTMVHCGPLDSGGNGYSDWDPGLGRDPNIIGLVLLGPSPPDDNPPYWPDQAKVQLSAQPRGGKVRVVVRGGKPGDTVTAFVTVS